MSATVADTLAAGAVEAAPRGFAAAAPANDQSGTLEGFPNPPAEDSARQASLRPRAPVTARRSSLFLLFSTKWVSLGRFQLPIWAHVGVLLLDRANQRATLYDVVSCGPRKKGGRS